MIQRLIRFLRDELRTPWHCNARRDNCSFNNRCPECRREHSAEKPA